MVCTAPYIEEFLRQCIRKAEKAGLLMVQIPSDEVRLRGGAVRGA
jgi:hypothetical protein